jgi:hypothetical protein
VVVCVYDSFSGIVGEVERFGRIVIDEAHHVLVPERYMETEREFEESGSEEDDEEWESEGEEDGEEDGKEEKKEERVVSYMSHIRSLAQTHRVVYLSATIDKPEDGSLFYEYKVRQAIQDGYLCDYQFVFPIFEQAYETNQHLAEYLVHQQQETHCLIYASSRTKGKEFVERLNALQAGCAGYIDGTTRPASRKKLFREFEEGKIRFLVNIRVLVEGFDAPHIRSVFFLRVSSNDIFIIQAIGRALRLHADKVKASVYVPFTHEGDIDKIQAFLSQLATYDERVGQSIKEKRVGGYVRLERGELVVAAEEDGDGDEKGEEKEKVFAFRYNLVVDRMGVSGKLEEMALRRAEEYIAWVGEKGRRPKLCLQHKKREDATEEEIKEHRVASWINCMKITKRGYHQWTLYPSVEQRLVNTFGEEWWKKIDSEINQIKNAQEYIEWTKKYNRNPRACQQKYIDNTPEEKEKMRETQVARWIHRMKRGKYGKSKQILYPSVEQLLTKEIGKEWYIIRDVEKKQHEKVDEYISWMKKYNKQPSVCVITIASASEEQKKEYHLTRWLKNMKRGKQGKGSYHLYPSVENRLNEVLGKKWYDTYEQKQHEKAIEYIAWMEAHNRQPRLYLRTIVDTTDEQKEEYRLTSWLSCMRRAKKGVGNWKLYPSVEELLVEALGPDWDTKKNKE